MEILRFLKSLEILINVIHVNLENLLIQKFV